MSTDHIKRGEAIDRVVHAALSLQASRIWGDLHPENPHGGDEKDYAEDGLIQACKDLVKGIRGEDLRQMIRALQEERGKEIGAYAANTFAEQRDFPPEWKPLSERMVQVDNPMRPEIRTRRGTDEV